MDRFLKIVIALALVIIALKLPDRQAVADAREVRITEIDNDAIEKLAFCIASKTNYKHPLSADLKCFN